MIYFSRLQPKCDVREGKWRGNWRMEWVASTLQTTSEHGVSGITTADTHTSAVSSRLNWRPRRFKWTRPFRRKTKSGLCACAITFQTQSNTQHPVATLKLIREKKNIFTNISIMKSSPVLCKCYGIYECEIWNMYLPHWKWKRKCPLKFLDIIYRASRRHVQEIIF